ncbi:MAG: multiheme c-type cytochrome, partial [Verrucomicrobiota bacterium]
MPRIIQQLLAAGLAILLAACGGDDAPETPPKSTSTESQTNPDREESDRLAQAKLLEMLFEPPVRNPTEGLEFVGAESCKTCHEQAYADWTKSHHHKAMQVANEETVLGDFNDA